MRCFVEPSDWSTDRILLPEEEVHHLSHVLRAKVGDTVMVTDGAGREAVTEVEALNRHSAVLRVVRQTVHEAFRPRLTLIQALPREQKLDYVIQKATELGIHAIVPVVSDHSVARIPASRADAKQDRWTRIAVNAIKQCGSVWLPAMHPVCPLVDYLDAMPRPDLFLTCSLDPDAINLHRAIQDAKVNRPSSVTVLVGPEGDLTARERSAARNAGSKMVSLGGLVMRSETASLYILSVLHYEFSIPEPP